MEITRYVYKCNLLNMLNHNMTLGDLIGSSKSESDFISKDKNEQKILSRLIKETIRIKITLEKES